MKATGMIRPVDSMGRIVIPKEIRKILQVENNRDSFEIFMERMLMCRRAAEKLGLQFKLRIDGQQLI